jgi:hypothetical protein
MRLRRCSGPCRMMRSRSSCADRKRKIKEEHEAVLGFWRMAQPFKALGDAVAGQHRFVASLKQSKRVWEEFGWDLLSALEL